MKIPRIVVSGMSGSSGKTLLSLGLARAWTQNGLKVQPFKKGPDYIDAAWLGLAAGRAAGNLDPFFLDGDKLRFLFQERVRRSNADVALIEGNRGLFDGRDVKGSCSTAQVAKTLETPVLLALNCAKMTRTAAALLQGLTGFDKDLHFAGVVLNNVGSARHAEQVRQAVEHYTDLKVLGAIPRLKNMLPERHMGLCLDGDEKNLKTESVLDALALLLRENIELNAIWHCAAHVEEMPMAADFRPKPCTSAAKPRIGYVKDAALWFYYQENLEALERAGAELVRLSILDATPWPQLDGLYLGGGFPELYAEKLAQSPHLAEIKRLSQSGLPIYAECGGFMLLCDKLLMDEQQYAMANIFSVTTKFYARPQGLGYAEACTMVENPFHPLESCWRGHEFHYSQVTEHPAKTVLNLNMGKGMGQSHDGLLAHNTFAAYTHLFAWAVPHWAECFAKAALNFRLSAGN